MKQNKIPYFDISAKCICSLWNRFRFSCHVFQYITNLLLTGKMVSFLDFTLQILIFPYCYHGNKWGVKTVSGTKSHYCIMGFDHSSTETNRLSQQDSAAAQPCPCKSLGAGTGTACVSVQLMANCLWQASGSFWGVGLCSHSAVSHEPSKWVLCQVVPWERVGISSLPSVPCPPPLSQNHSGKTNRKQIKSDNKVAAPAWRRTSPILMRAVWLMINNDSNNKEREATDSFSVCRCSPVLLSWGQGAALDFTQEMSWACSLPSSMTVYIRWGVIFQHLLLSKGSIKALSWIFPTQIWTSHWTSHGRSSWTLSCSSAAIHVQHLICFSTETSSNVDVKNQIM